MKAFIKKEQYNAINKHMKELASVLKFCPDTQVVESNKLHCELQIFNLFEDLDDQQMKQLELISIDSVKKIENYLANLDEYVYGMDGTTPMQLKKLFKKEKHLKLPSDEILTAPKVYLGWQDTSNKKLYMAYYHHNTLLGMACKIQPAKPTAANICKLCNHVGGSSEVAFVSPVCKSSGDGYRSIGFYACLDSQKCNERITSTINLVNLFLKVTD